MGQEGGGGERMERGRKRSAEEACGEEDEGVACDLGQEWPRLYDEPPRLLLLLMT